MNIIRLLSENDGFRIINRLFHAHILGTVILDVLRFGTSRGGLELVRANAQYTVQKKLKKKYKKFLIRGNLESISSEQPVNKTIWICWLQGIHKAPSIVKKCVDSVEKNFPGYKIQIITEKNYKEFVKFPAFVEEKKKLGIISKTHFSDLLRLELLLRYGGIWIDSTVYMTGKIKSRQILDADLFMFQELKPGSDGHCMPMSSWFIVAKPNNRILHTTQVLLYEYWKNNNKLIDYFLLHHFLNISKDYFIDEWDKIPKYSNGDTHILLLELFTRFDNRRFDEIKRITAVHKLSYKFDDSQIELKGTFFEKIFEEK